MTRTRILAAPIAVVAPFGRAFRSGGPPHDVKGPVPALPDGTTPSSGASP